jgi:hypothetical protein
MGIGSFLTSTILSAMAPFCAGVGATNNEIGIMINGFQPVTEHQAVAIDVSKRYEIDIIIKMNTTIADKNYYSLKEAVFNEDLIIGENPPYFNLFNDIRNNHGITLPTTLDFPFSINDVYSCIIEKVESADEYLMTTALLYMLSLIEYTELQECEKVFVSNMLNHQDIRIQEYAINAVSLWNNKHYIEQVRDSKITDTFLKQRFDKIIKRHFAV